MTKGAMGNLINRYRAVLKKCHLLNTFGSLAIVSMIVMGSVGMAEAAIYTNPIEEYWGDRESDSSYEGYEGIRVQNGNETIYDFGEGGTINYDVNGKPALGNYRSVAISINSYAGFTSPIPAGKKFTIKGDLDINITDVNGEGTTERASTVGIEFNAGESFLTAEDAISINASSNADEGDAYSAGVSVGNLGSAASSSGVRPAIGENIVSFNTLNIDLSSTTQRGAYADAYAVEMRGNSSITINDLKVSATAGGADENYARGILATDEQGVPGGTITVNNADITAAVEGPGNAIGVISFLDFETIGSTVHIEEGSIVAKSLDGNGSAYGVFAEGESCAITLGSDTAKSISVEAQGGINNHALHSYLGTITATADQIDLKADRIIYAYGGDISVTSLKTGTLNGDVRAVSKEGTAGTASLDLRGNTHWTGKTSIGEGSQISLALKDQARWNMTDSSAMSMLTLNKGIVDLTYDLSGATTLSQAGTRTLTVDTLNGSGGTFHVNTDIDADTTDQIIIANGTGSHGVYVNPTGSGATREAMDSFIVQQQNGDGAFALANEGGRVDQGLYFYELAERNGNAGAREWYLKRSGDDLTPTGETEVALSSLAGHYAMWYGQLTDLRKRLGEVRYGSQTGLWVRGFADKERLDGFAGAGFTQNLVGGSIGYDWLASSGGDSQWILGMQIRSGHADQDVTGRWGGYGDLTSVGGGLYSTWLHGDGWFLDAVATMDWYEHEIRTGMSDGTRVNDDRSSWGLGLSLEGGRRFDFAYSNNGLNSWFVEPQLELSWFWVHGGDFTASNGMRVDQDDMNSLTARAGVVLGKKFALDGGDGSRYVQPYVKAGLVQEFLGDQEARFNGERFTSDLDGTRVYYGLGVDWQAADNMRLYLQAEREEGEHFTREYQVSAGLKFSF